MLTAPRMEELSRIDGIKIITFLIYKHMEIHTTLKVSPLWSILRPINESSATLSSYNIEVKDRNLKLTL